MNKLSITSINNRAPLQVTTRNGAFEFFAENDSAILYICDVKDDKQSARDRLFAMWFNSYEGRFNYTLSRVSLRIEETDYYASLLICNSNPSYVEVLTAFNDFIKEFPGKLE
ncbi:MAG: hypothetical protein II276_03145 [Bacteroidales bacterium]|nr:hypothetical protein [Bacteroidales bacterium]MBQ2452439.1 hypothetical protein [Bacteroidales bacterium]